MRVIRKSKRLSSWGPNCARTPRAALRALSLGVAIALSSCHETQQATGASCSEALVVLPLADNVKCVVRPEQEELSYEVVQEWPATEGLKRIQETLRKQGWRPMLEDFLNPGVPSSHVVGWRSYLEDDRTVQQWLAQWKNEHGEVVWYALIYKSPEHGEQRPTGLSVKAVLFKAPAAKKMQEYGRGVGRGLAGPGIGPAAECDVSERAVQRAARPACVADDALAEAPLRFGELYNLALLGTATVRADSFVAGHAASLLRDGWYGECSSWVPGGGAGGAAYTELDLGAIFRVSGIAITADPGKSGPAHSWRLDVMAGWSGEALSRIGNYEGPVFKGTRLFSFEPTAVRVVRLQLGTVIRVPLETKSGTARVDEIEVYGECIK